MTTETTIRTCDDPAVLRELENLAELADRVMERIRDLSQGICEPDWDIATFALFAADVIHQDGGGVSLDRDGWHRAICAIAKAEQQ